MLAVLGLMGVMGGVRVDGRVGSLLLFCVALWRGGVVDFVQVVGLV